MKTTERPILMSAPMVRAILAGTKTQTRRAVKGWPLEWLSPPVSITPEYVAHPDNKACPYGSPGDHLWVREAWARTIVHPGTELVVYREGDNRTDYGGPWKPGIHMFRRDSRILLEVTEVRVERLQAISEEDAQAEGGVEAAGWPGWWSHTGQSPSDKTPGDMSFGGTACDSYRLLWDQINGAGAWDLNPFVWAVSFRVVKP